MRLCSLGPHSPCGESRKRLGGSRFPNSQLNEAITNMCSQFWFKRPAGEQNLALPARVSGPSSGSCPRCWKPLTGQSCSAQEAEEHGGLHGPDRQLRAGGAQRVRAPQSGCGAVDAGLALMKGRRGAAPGGERRAGAPLAQPWRHGAAPGRRQRAEPQTVSVALLWVPADAGGGCGHARCCLFQARRGKGPAQLARACAPAPPHTPRSLQNASLRLWVSVILMCVNEEVSFVSPLPSWGRSLLGTHRRLLELYKRVMAVNLKCAARNT